MKITTHHYALIVVAFLLLAAGFTISTNLTVSTPSENTQASPDTQQSSRILHPTSIELHRDLASIDNQSGAERLLNLIATIERSTLETLPDLAEHFANDEAVLKLIALHWFNLDPHHCLSTLLENRKDPDFPSQSIFYPLSERWMAQDFPGFINAIDGLSLQERKWNTFNDIFCSIFEIDYKVGFRLLREAEINFLSTSPLQIKELAAEDPLKIATSIRQESSGYALTDALCLVANVWAKTEPEEALAYALDIPGINGSSMSSAALTSWTTIDPDSAAAWLTAQPNARIRDELRPSLLKTWHKQDPEAAQQYCLTHLAGFRQRQALRLLEKESQGR